METDNLSDMISHLDTIEVTDGRYLLKYENKKFISYQKRIGCFILNLIATADRFDILKDKFMLRSIVALIAKMNTSTKLAIKHTGVYIGK